jgi:hypothetical protein
MCGGEGPQISAWKRIVHCIHAASVVVCNETAVAINEQLRANYFIGIWRLKVVNAILETARRKLN